MSSSRKAGLGSSFFCLLRLCVAASAFGRRRRRSKDDEFVRNDNPFELRGAVIHEGDSSFRSAQFGMTVHLLKEGEWKAIRQSESPSIPILPQKAMSFRALARNLLISSSTLYMLACHSER